MIILRVNTKQTPMLHSFVVHYSTGSSQYAKFLGFIADDYPIKEGEGKFVKVIWLNEQPITPGSNKRLGKKVHIKSLKVISPYYKNGSKQGEFTIHSYLALFNELQLNYRVLKVNTLDDPNEVELLTYKNRATIGDNVRITDAKIFYENKLQTLNAQIFDFKRTDGTIHYDLILFDSMNTKLLHVTRSQFELAHQDEYKLATVKCSYCGRN